MRHATSESNLRLRRHWKENNIRPQIDNYKVPHEFECTYEKPEQIDAALSYGGVTSCISKREAFEKKHPNIKYVLCSPYRRAIQTMVHMTSKFTNKLDPKNVIMYPQITEQIHCLGEFAFETENLMKRYKDLYDWSFYSTKRYFDPKIWFLYNINESHGKNNLKWK